MSAASDSPAARSSSAGGEAKVTKELVIENQLGMHARPSAQFVKIANRHRAEIWVEKDGEQVNGKSIMGLMMLAAGQGTKLKVSAEGPDAAEALAELESLVRNRFSEQ